MSDIEDSRGEDDPLDNPTMNLINKAIPIIVRIAFGIGVLTILVGIPFGIKSLLSPKTIQSEVPAEISDLHEVGDPLREKDIFYIGAFQGCVGAFILSSDEFNPINKEMVVPYCIEVAKAGVDLGVYEISLDAIGELDE